MHFDAGMGIGVVMVRANQELEDQRCRFLCQRIGKWIGPCTYIGFQSMSKTSIPVSAVTVGGTLITSDASNIASSGTR